MLKAMHENSHCKCCQITDHTTPAAPIVAVTFPFLLVVDDPIASLVVIVKWVVV